jgi:outer membrane lipoprotein SlyB
MHWHRAVISGAVVVALGLAGCSHGDSASSPATEPATEPPIS